MVTFAPSDNPPDAIVSFMMQSDSSISPRLQSGDIIVLQAKKDSQKTKETIAKKIRLPGPTGPCDFKVYIEDGPYNVALFCNPTYRIKISICITSNGLLAVASLLDTDTSPSSIEMDILPPGWKESVRSIKSQQSQTGKSVVVNIEGLLLLFIRIGDLCVRAWFVIFKNLAVDVLFVSSFIDTCVCGIFPPEYKSVPCLLRPVAVISTKAAISLIKANDRVFQLNINTNDHAPSEDFNLCRVACQIIIFAYFQAAVLGKWWRAALMTIGTCSNLVEHWSSMTIWDLVNVSLGKLF